MALLNEVDSVQRKRQLNKARWRKWWEKNRETYNYNRRLMNRQKRLQARQRRIPSNNVFSSVLINNENQPPSTFPHMNAYPIMASYPMYAVVQTPNYFAYPCVSQLSVSSWYIGNGRSSL